MASHVPFLKLRALLWRVLPRLDWVNELYIPGELYTLLRRESESDPELYPIFRRRYHHFLQDNRFLWEAIEDMTYEWYKLYIPKGAPPSEPVGMEQSMLILTSALGEMEALVRDANKEIAPKLAELDEYERLLRSAAEVR